MDDEVPEPLYVACIFTVEMDTVGIEG
jgi:hypothetical protein